MKMKRILLSIICMVVCLYAQGRDVAKNVNIVYIGNSITQGALLQKPDMEAPPVCAVRWLAQQPGMGTVEFSNQGVSGATSVDFLPASGTLFVNVKKAADRFKGVPSATLLFSIMLGTNDSAIKGPNGSPVSPKQYYTNIKAIVDELLALYPGCRVVLHRPVWYSPNTYNSAMYLREGLRRLESYLPELQSLTLQYAQSHPQHVFMGDVQAFDYFKQNYLTALFPEEGNAGTFYLHPNRVGAERLGGFWGEAIYGALGK